MKAVLGLNLMHADTSAALVVNGKVVAAIAEERLGSREKHSSAFPIESIRFVLKVGGISLSDLSYIAVARDPQSNLWAKIRWSVLNLNSSLPAFLEVLSRNSKTSKSVSGLSPLLTAGEPKAAFKFYPVEHHVAHIASSYYSTDTSVERLGISYDGSGDFVSVMSALCSAGNIIPKRRIFLPASLGLFYTAMCQFIGFDRFGEEYKVMGLAPYGDDLYSKELSEVLQLNQDGSFRLNPDFIKMHSGGRSGQRDGNNEIDMDLLYKPALTKLLGSPILRDDPDVTRQRNIAKSTQKMFERAAINFIAHEQKVADISDLVMAGGSALNGVANARIYRDIKNIKSVYLHPAAGDDGTAVGAALFCYNKEIEMLNPYAKELFSPYLGSEYTDMEIIKELNRRGLQYRYVEDDELYKLVAQKIKNAEVVGWFQGRSEWGPRALGNRSILADASNPDIKAIINRKIKRRESFRPFAPSVLEADVPVFFQQDIQSPYMMHVVEFKDEWKEKLPGVVHVDGTGRLQSVSYDLNPRYHSLIAAFKELSGIGLLLNTSFNENEPIVENPAQAIDCYLRTDMDSLVLGNFVLSK